jgi:N-acetylglutamate synthase-like GNAT family acetyltransferase
MIRKASLSDLDAIKHIADTNKDTIGFVMRPALQMALAKHWLLVAEQEGRIIGFCNYRHCRNGQTTIYELCVSEQYRRQGIGRALVEAVAGECVSYIQLKAVATILANDFYKHLGFVLVGQEQGRKRPLNVWRYYAQPDLLCWWEPPSR